MPEKMATIVQGTIKGLANGATQSAMTGHGFKNLNWGEIAANSFGNALVDELAGSIAKKDATASTQTSEIDPIQYGFSNKVISEIGVIKPNQYDYGSYNLDALQKIESATVNASDYKGSVERIAREKLGKNASQHEINTYVGQLIELNQIKNPRFIKANQILTLPNEHTPLPTTGLEIYAKDILYGENLKAQALWVAQQQAAARQAVTKQGDYFDFNKHHTGAKGGLPYGNEAGEYSNALFKNLGTSMSSKYTQHSQQILTQDTSSRWGRIKAIWADNNTTTLNKLGDTVGFISTPSAQRAKQHNVALSFDEDTWSGVSKELTAMTIDMGNQVIQTQPFLQTHTYILGFDASKYSTQIRSSITLNESAGAGEVEKMALFLSIASLGRGGGKSVGHYGRIQGNIAKGGRLVDNGATTIRSLNTDTRFYVNSAGEILDVNTYARNSGFRAGVREKVWTDAVDKTTGLVKDPLTGTTMNKSKPWDMGHRSGMEYWKERNYSIQQWLDKSSYTTRKQFLDKMNDPSRYRPELPSSNRSHHAEDVSNIFWNN